MELIDTEKMELNNMDVLFNEALKLVKEKGRASIRLLQRHFKIGYTRASRLIDEMERQELISPPDSENQRVLLV